MTGRLPRFVLAAVAAAHLLSATFPAGAGAPSDSPAAASQEGWKAEFEAVCAGTESAAALSRTELADRIARCDRLRPAIEALEESTRKVFQRRLKMCRDLYSFLLERASPPAPGTGR